MQIDQHTIEEAARRIGIKAEELAAVAERGSAVSYQAGDYLFHESTPRNWLGFVLDGEVEIVRGQLGSTVLLSVLQPGAIVSEGVILDDTPHATSGVARHGTRVWQIPRAQLEAVREQDPRVFYHLVGQIARRVADRLRLASERLLKQGAASVVGGVRREHDSLGEREVPQHAYYGVQTLRAVENFPFSGVRVRHYEHFVRALAYVKKAAALTNAELGVLDPKIAQAIAGACDDIVAGKYHNQFMVDMIQGGAGTSTNMCANEVIANVALERLGHAKGEYQYCHPNDHVNCSQSTNDAYPSSLHLAMALTNTRHRGYWIYLPFGNIREEGRGKREE